MEQLLGGAKLESNIFTQLFLSEQTYQSGSCNCHQVPSLGSCKKDLFGMIKQLGLRYQHGLYPLSAAETRWKDLLKSLGKFVDDVECTDEEVANFTWETQNRLIRADPVAVTRYFDHRVKKFSWNFLQSSCEPLGKICEFTPTEGEKKNWLKRYILRLMCKMKMSLTQCLKLMMV